MLAIFYMKSAFKDDFKEEDKIAEKKLLLKTEQKRASG